MLQSRCETFLGALISIVGRPIVGAAAAAGAAGAAGAGSADSAAGAGAVGDGLAATGNGIGVGLGVGRGCTLGLTCGTGGVGFGGGGAIDCRAAGAATGAGLNNSAVMVRDSSGRPAGSLRTVKITASSAIWIATTAAVALTVWEFIQLEGASARPAGTECEARML